MERDTVQDPDCEMKLPERRRVRMPLVGLACAAGDRLPLERGLSEVSGVLDVYVNLVDEAAHLTFGSLPARRGACGRRTLRGQDGRG